MNWFTHLTAVFKVHVFELKKHYWITTAALTGNVLSVIVNTMLHLKDSFSSKYDDIPDFAANMVFGSLPLFYLILTLVTKQKENKIYLTFRCLGMYESAYWTATFLIGLILSLLSSLLMALFLFLLRNHLWYFLSKTSLLLIWVLIFLQNLIICAGAQSIASMCSTVSGAEVGFLLYIFKNWYFMAYMGFNEFGLFRNPMLRILGSLITPWYPWYSTWKEILYSFYTNIDDLLYPNLVRELRDFYGFPELLVSIYDSISDQKFLKFYEITEDVQFPAPIASLLVFPVLTPFLLVLSWYFAQVIPYHGYKFTSTFFMDRKYWISAAKGESIILNHLSKSYEKRAVIDNLSSTFEKGSIFTLLGKNGAGKSTLMKILGCLTNLDTGEGIIVGYDVQTQARQIRSVTGYCPQFESFFDDWSPFDHISIYCEFKGIVFPSLDEKRNFCLQKLKTVNLDGVMDKPVGGFSGGMKRRLCFILATIGKNQVYLLDEPTTGLDPISSKMVLDVIETLKENAVVILTTHDMEEASLVSDHIILLKNGQIELEGSPSRLRSLATNVQKLEIGFLQELRSPIPMTVIKEWISSVLGEHTYLKATKNSLFVTLDNLHQDSITELVEKIEEEKILWCRQVRISLDDIFWSMSATSRPEGEEKGFAWSSISHFTGRTVVEEFAAQNPHPAFTSSFYDQFRAHCFRFWKLCNGQKLSFVVIFVMYAIIYHPMSQTLQPLNALSKNLISTWYSYTVLGYFLMVPFLTKLVESCNDPDLNRIERLHGSTLMSFWSGTYCASILVVLLINPFVVSVWAALYTNFDDVIIHVIIWVLSSNATVLLSFFLQRTLRNAPSILLYAIIYYASFVQPESPYFDFFPIFGIHRLIGMKSNGSSLWIETSLRVLGGSFIVGLLGTLVVPSYKTLVPTKLEDSCNSHKVDMDLQRKGVIFPLREAREVYLRATELNKTFKDVTAVDSLTFEVCKDETFVLLGENGAGKSTAFKMLSGTLEPSSGQFELFQNLTICDQNNHLFEYLSVMDHLKFYGLLNGTPFDKIEDRIKAVTQSTLLTQDLLGKYPMQLSGGMLRRVCVAIALTRNANLILLDEPSSGLDPANRKELWTTIAQIRKDSTKSIMITTHSVTEAEQFADRVGMNNSFRNYDKGKLCWFGHSPRNVSGIR
jgi:ABC-type multidrug transport system ATPase subunit